MSTIQHPPGAPAAGFPNYTELPSYLPTWAWRLLRMGAVLGALGMAALLVIDPGLGLPLFWGLVVPVLPLVFMFTPGLWRNLCPLATSNQMPRRLGISQGWTQKALSQGLAYPIGIALLIGGVIGRKLLFNLNGLATAGLILAAMAAALIGGLLFKGKSGWCSSICPLLPVQRLYGQTPFIKVANTQCEPCVGCAKNCYDFNPGVAYLADQYDPNPNYRDFRRFFAGVFPGLILGYYLVPGAEQIGALPVLLQMLMYLAASLSLFTLLDLLLGGPRNVAPVLAAALAINLYYWFAAPLVAQVLLRLGVHPDLTLVGGLRTAVAIGSLIWVARSLQVERLFLSEQLRRSGAGEIPLAPVVVETLRLNRRVIPITQAVEAAPGSGPSSASSSAPACPPADEAPARRPDPVACDAGPASAAEPRPAAAASPAPGARAARGVLRIEPSGRVAALRTGRSLLDLLEGCGADIHPGCRAGVCGADPIAVTAGADCLGPITDTERATLARLGHAPNTRLACMARVRQAGEVRVGLTPQAAGAAGADPALPEVSQPAPWQTRPALLDSAPRRSGPTDAARPLAAALPTLHDAVRPLHATRRREPANDTARGDAGIRRVVIVGNGIAGLTAAEELRRHHPDCSIQLIAREGHLSYNRIALTSLITRHSAMQGLGLKPEGWYAEQRIDTWLNTRATGLDTRAQQLQLATGEALAYDRLIIASGALAWVPPIAGFGLPGCYVLRHANDAMSMRAYVQRHRVRRAVVVGAGLLGLEAAAALRELDLDLRLLSLSDRVLDRQIDAPASRMVVSQLRRHNIELVSNAQLRAVEAGGHGRLQRLNLEDGRTLDAELLVLCAGTRPELTLARAGGLDCGRGVRVDTAMRSSAARVFAAGDVAECEGQMHGLWGIATEQGRVAALSALGLPAAYQPRLPVTALKLRDIQVRAAGQAEPKGATQTELHLPPAPDESPEDDAGVPADRHCKLVLDGETVIGAVVVGFDPDADELLQAASQRADLATLQALLTARGLPAGRPRSASAPQRAAAAGALKTRRVA